jgi:geranylgeranyl reductase family protein
VWDVVVVGAGPAGSSSALAACESGASTLLLDAAEFPRYKTCGGGLIGISSSLVRDFAELPIKDEITKISFTLEGRKERVREADHSVMRMVSREDLDDHLVRRAIAAGACFRPGTKVSVLRETAGGLILLTTSSGEVSARAVVGADGSSGRTARYVGVEYAVTDIGLEYELEAAGQAKKWRGRVHLDWGPIPGSYAWVFPKAETLTVGVIAERGNPGETRDYLASFVRQLGMEDLRVLRDSGHLTRCRADSSPLSRGRVLVAGDAAGLLEPWTREGISFAIRSGRFAGKRAAQIARAENSKTVASGTAGYRSDVESTLAYEMRAGALSRNAFATTPWMFHFLVGWTRQGWRYFGRISSGDTTLGRAVRHPIARIPLRLLAGRPGRGKITLGDEPLLAETSGPSSGRRDSRGIRHA